jgi:surface polysaccharide O-acyltransferase-like enzyme
MNSSKRLLPIDAVRGLAMFFVCISHISYFFITSAPVASAMFRNLGFFATPNFLLMSGLACGYRLASSSSGATVMRIVDRGLFVLLIGHIAIAGSLVYIVLPGTAFEHIVITDCIGLLLCTAPALRVLPARQLLPAGAAIYLVSSVAGLIWAPTSTLGAVVGGLLLGIPSKALPDLGWTSATVPLFGLFLIGVGVGKLICEFRREGSGDVLWRRLFVVGAAAAVIALLMTAGRYFVKSTLLADYGGDDWVYPLLAGLELRQKIPPSPAYALFYGGLGLALVGLLGRVVQSKSSDAFVGRTARVAAIVGRASFVAYATQQWLIEFLPYPLGWEGALRSPLASCAYLLAAMLVMFLVASAWDRAQGNRYLTLGLRPTARGDSSSWAAAFKKAAWSVRKAVG